VNWYFDTSVLVPAAVKGHVHYSRAVAALDEMVVKRRHGYMSAHSLAEVYSVLTRAPFSPPVYPSEAWQIIEQNFLPYLEIVPLSAKEYLKVVRDCATRGLAGGRVYDALHLYCAQKSGCDRIYTFDVKDFRALAPEGLEDKVCAP
jgi:predicted nucleic acid-binding protein